MMEFKTAAQIEKMSHERNIERLGQKVLTLQVSDKFRLAALLLDAGKLDLAESVAVRGCQEIKLSKILGRVTA